MDDVRSQWVDGAAGGPGSESLAYQRSRAIIWVTLAWWATNVAVFALQNVLQRHPHLLGMTGMRILLALFGMFLCFGLYSALQKWRHRSLLSRGLLLALLAPIVAEIYAWVAYFGFSLVNHERFDRAIDWTKAISTNATYSWFFIAWASLCLAVEYASDAKGEELRASELARIAQSAKLRALYNQINPHFLFNSLNSISALIGDKRLEDADHMIDLLANYFRKTLAIDPNSDVRLIDEIHLQLEYLAIEQARYPDLAVDVDLPPELERAAVPALLLQPLVENAVKHGVACCRPPARIVIRGERQGPELLISVENYGERGTRETRHGAGIGLQNVRERLRNRFGDRQELTVGPVEGGYRAAVRMPWVSTS